MIMKRYFQLLVLLAAIAVSVSVSGCKKEKPDTPSDEPGTVDPYTQGSDTPGGDTPGGETPGGEMPSGNSGSLTNPFTAKEACAFVKPLTWTSSTDYQTTDIVYVKGFISRIISNGYFKDSGTFGNASFYISEDGTEYEEFCCFRILYLGNEKYNGGTDIKVGDNVVICGKLMNYKGNTPQSAAGQAYLYSLNGNTTSDGGTPSTENSITFFTNSEAQTWATSTDGTYGSGFEATTHGLKIAFFKHTSNSNPVAPNANQLRIYKNSVFCLSPVDGKKIKKLVIHCAPDAGTTSYCHDMTVLEGASTAMCDKEALTITWTGSTSKLVLHANYGQVRVEKITVVLE